MKKIKSGLENLCNSLKLQKLIEGNVAYICHPASVNNQLIHGAHLLKDIFDSRLVKLFGPQHGIFSVQQDNMVETPHQLHPDKKLHLPIYSLYSEVRKPNCEMLEGINTLIFDLQDVGVRVYTYIHTLKLLFEALDKTQIKLIVLDRPNPINGVTVEGNILDMEYSSFVGLFEIPMRHGMTMGEIGLFIKNTYSYDVNYDVIKLENWDRSNVLDLNHYSWVMPSPNLPTIEGVLLYPGFVALEGTNISEGRGTTRPFEFFGHPDINPYELLEEIQLIKANPGITFRPVYFEPTFNKHKGMTCGGFQMHLTNNNSLDGIWKYSVQLISCVRTYLGDKFSWKESAYEYNFTHNPFDLIHGTDQVRKWMEYNGRESELTQFEVNRREQFLKLREKSLIYE